MQIALRSVASHVELAEEVGVAGELLQGLQELRHLLIVAAFVALVGQIGDLAESLLKRDAQVKDISKIIPGHGGILDRFDSLLFVAPVVYYYLKFVVY